MSAEAAAELEALRRNTKALASLLENMESMQQTNQALLERIANQSAELAEVKALFPAILEAIGNGSKCAPDCSLEFLRHIPAEVRIAFAALRTAGDALEKALMHVNGMAMMLVDGRQPLQPYDGEQVADALAGWRDRTPAEPKEDR